MKSTFLPPSSLQSVSCRNWRSCTWTPTNWTLTAFLPAWANCPASQSSWLLTTTWSSSQRASVGKQRLFFHALHLERLRCVSAPGGPRNFKRETPHLTFTQPQRTLCFATTYSNCACLSFQVWQAEEAGAEQKPSRHAARGHPLPHRLGGTWRLPPLNHQSHLFSLFQF